MSDYSMGVSDFKCISNDGFTGIDRTQVMHFTCMVQDTGSADFTAVTMFIAGAVVFTQYLLKRVKTKNKD